MPAYPRPTVALQYAFERVEDFFLRSYPVRDLPLNVRPAIIAAVAVWTLLLGVLGFAPLPELPLNDKALHFFGMGFAAFLIYFVFEVPEGPHRRVWYIRRAPLLLTLVLAFLFGGVISEFIQAMLPWKHFQFGDIVANLLGTTVFLYLAHLLHSRARRRSEIADLYQPLPSHSYRDAQGRTHAFAPAAAAGGAGAVAVELEETEGHDTRDVHNDVWDDEIDDLGPRENSVFKLDDDIV
ncbi:hypothetical protein CcaverHIS002_0509610 [Cutaneotrichosporon cavernicola]|uniref:VanZ-like domain-containing protein n=1 Tax=Cutaneotrichosporon cavernicola TaxID=279322 RepID=A0AA48QXB3_9TREE|nr:uncharacterized protein CcaverHIS019_0510170 [Cutaneotrichosporon cavernicola]BEI85560.1 hypothetical protein CcaverHIS002_0509610 [Cutaneotrichosporon cavernicola]BEI93389.1 hypothetical protein CcaverHIS019_0510170 [Cutaneotrichosporon cavernicola]BEJ01167.1 hypothetical protein CcaverHIS631_0510240 [Cutaneotrichosporon cavernicola]BEJ08935.1 hypothetical protein CcaverHIS641_0510290 [Cutaneotrichosporon cavernicola]